MTFPIGYSYILMNQNDSTTLADTSKQRLNIMGVAASPPSFKIKLGALPGVALSIIASIGTFMALTAF